MLYSHIIPSLLTAFIITYFAIPSIIKIAYEKNLCDEPGERRSHSRRIPTLGGLGIFAGLIFSITFWIPFNIPNNHIQYILCSFIIIFLIGAKDDIIPLTPNKKFMGQLLAAFILVFKADIYLDSLYGILGIYDLPNILSSALSIFTIIVIINALNLIDGINGLSASVGCIICACLGYWFYQNGYIGFATISAAMIGSLIAFLRYNATPANIFMGDTGSLLLGLTIAILSIKFIRVNEVYVNEHSIQSVPAVAIGILIIPLFDTLRVFTMRTLKRRSPFSPDRTHIHHLLLDLGFSHMQATAMLSFINLLFIILVFQLQWLGSLPLLILIFGLATVLSFLLMYLVRKKQVGDA